MLNRNDDPPKISLNIGNTPGFLEVTEESSDSNKFDKFPDSENAREILENLNMLISC